MMGIFRLPLSTEPDRRHSATMDNAAIFLTFGALFMGGLAADLLGRRLRLPRVTLLLALGILAGRSGLDLLPIEFAEWFSFLTVAALSMVAFLLGGGLTLTKLRHIGGEVLWVSLSIVGVTVALVAFGLIVLGAAPALALIFGALACATDPAATQDAIRQSGSSHPFADKLSAIVAMDDAWGLIVFALVVAMAKGLDGSFDPGLLMEATREIGGAVALGLVIGLALAPLTGRLKPGEPLQAEALGIVFLSAGAALWLDVSYLIASMVVGLVITNRARHHTRAFHEIEHIQWPIMILFFVLAGAALDLRSLAAIGALGAGFAVLRVLARALGGWVGATLARSPAPERRWFGPALLPQAGVAVGMALVAATEFPDHGDTILTLTIGATVLFELIGPAATLFSIRRVDPSSNRSEGDL
ncbi:cation:proton antiporter [Aliiroseovarius sp.]|uniref:cation:proton antiporter n=1 Tax=Aliiroseovarius sp. TaxID=1872442 RepID=UPI00262066AD|nr:cation:proton antiporter [Aliiroseovarius sp.]